MFGLAAAIGFGRFGLILIPHVAWGEHVQQDHDGCPRGQVCGPTYMHMPETFAGLQVLRVHSRTTVAMVMMLVDCLT